MGIQQSVNQAVNAVSAATAIPHLMKQRLSQQENRAYTVQRRKQLAIKRDAEAAAKSRLEDRKKLLTEQKKKMYNFYIGGEQVEPGTALYNKLVKGVNNGSTKQTSATKSVNTTTSTKK